MITREMREEFAAANVDNSRMAPAFTRTLKFKVRPESYRWLDAAALEVNQVWNYANETSYLAATRTDLKRKWLTGFDLCNLTSGSSEFFEHIGADTIQRVCTEYAQKRKAAKRVKLRWRVSRESRRSLGWIPFKAASLKCKGRGIRFCGKTFRIFEADRLAGVKWQQGCFAQDAVGEWWLCLPVEIATEESIAPRESVGIDLGIKDVAVTSDGEERLGAQRFYRDAEAKLALLQRRGHLKQAKRLHRKIRRRRLDACHKFSRRVVDRYQNIYLGDVSSLKLVRTHLAKGVLDSGWGMLKRMLRYKGEHAGRFVEIVCEKNTSRACSNCGALSGPRDLRQLAVKAWDCACCGERHDRDVNAARNILMLGSRCRTSVSGNESPSYAQPPSHPYWVREAGLDAPRWAA
jgi:putative transposase